MSRLRVPAALSITLLAAASCAPQTVTPDASDDAPIDMVSNDTAAEDVPTSCDAVPFVSYCLKTQPDSAVNCGPSRVCYESQCTTQGCTFCSFPVECHRMDSTTSYCFTTCDSSQCTGDCPLIA